VFDLSPRNRLAFRVVGREIVHLNLAVSDPTGTEMLRVTDGHVEEAPGSPLVHESRPGRIRVTAPATLDYLPAEALVCFGGGNDAQIVDGRFTVVEVEVIEPGKVRVQGVWIEGPRGVVVGPHTLCISGGQTGSLCFLIMEGYSKIPGDRGIATVNLTGPITHESMFRLAFKNKDL
jgi:hypothetical protein